MWNNGSGRFALVLNAKAAKDIEWHCKHYGSRGLMKQFKSGAELAAAMGVPAETLASTLAEYNEAARTGVDPIGGKKFFTNAPFEMDEGCLLCMHAMHEMDEGCLLGCMQCMHAVHAMHAMHARRSRELAS